jgi:hypothetical protein
MIWSWLTANNGDVYSKQHNQDDGMINYQSALKISKNQKKFVMLAFGKMGQSFLKLVFKENNGVKKQKIYPCKIICRWCIYTCKRNVLTF